MYSIYKSAIVFHPESMQNLFEIMSKNSDYTIVAGATHIMRLSEGEHPNQLGGSLIVLDKIDRLFNLRKTSGYIEIGSMVSLVKICEFFSTSLPKPFLDCVNKTFSPSLQQIVTLGGTIGASKVFYDISSPLVCSGTLIDISKFTSLGFKDFRIPIDEYFQYSEEEKHKIIIRGFLIPVSEHNTGYIERSNATKFLDYYKTYSNSYSQPHKSVVISSSFAIYNDGVDDAHIAITYADIGVHNMVQTSSAMCDNASEYLDSRQIEHIRSVFEKELVEFYNDSERTTSALHLFDSIIEDIQLEIL